MAGDDDFDFFHLFYFLLLLFFDFLFFTLFLIFFIFFSSNYENSRNMEKMAMEMESFSFDTKSNSSQKGFRVYVGGHVGILGRKS